MKIHLDKGQTNSQYKILNVMEIILKIASGLLGLMIPLLFAMKLNQGIKNSDLDLKRKRKYRQILIVSVALSTVLVWAFSLSGILEYHRGDMIPRFAIPLIVFAVIGLYLLKNKPFQGILFSIPLSSLVSIQIFRFAGTAFLIIAYLKILPQPFQLAGYGDILTGTLGKALGGASGGYVSGPKPLIEMLRQRSRPYLFSNSLPPVVVAASIEALRILKGSSELPRRLHANTEFFRARMTELGIDIIPGEHPIVPVMVGDAARAARMAEYLLERGVYVVGFSFPVVPLGKARIRTQVSAAHTTDELARAAALFREAADNVA